MENKTNGIPDTGYSLFPAHGIIVQVLVRISLALYIVGQTVSSTHRVILLDHLNEKHSDIK